MTLDEAIKHAEEVMEEKLYEYQECVAVHDTENATDCRECGEEHRQLAEWLKDYKRLLEQPTSDDCVSRQAVLDCLTATGLKKFDFILDAREKVNNLPPVTPARKVGKWIEEPNCWLRCSCCNSHYPHTSIYAIKGSNYCPNCGADMRGSENE